MKKEWQPTSAQSRPASTTASVAAPPPSLLSMQLRAEYKQSVASSASVAVEVVAANLKSIIVYTPKRQPIKVVIEDADIVATVITKALDAHRKEKIQPELQYHAAECYDLRLHEGK